MLKSVRGNGGGMCANLPYSSPLTDLLT
uniref:Uncharacterized protein n=1 Tax=Physcomitrium patens TaxID=3218 RepID=A0A2K1IMP5_PHYPA|nr:hypothetical protein PHYPA_026862 [Physcomitrium patens]